MKPRQRQAQIADLVENKGEASVDYLAGVFAVSSETIRRDLSLLAETGVVQKVHGGAKRSRLFAEGSFQERMSQNTAGKAVIAEKLTKLVEPGDTIFIDTGSTTLACAHRLASIKNLTVITNCVRIAHVIGEGPGESQIYLIGGAYRTGNGQTVGPQAIEHIRSFQADHAVIAVAALDQNAGAMDAAIEEAHVARAMVDCSNSLIIVADASKFERKAAYRVCELKEIDVLVSDQLPPPSFAAILEGVNVEVR